MIRQKRDSVRNLDHDLVNMSEGLRLESSKRQDNVPLRSSEFSFQDTQKKSGSYLRRGTESSFTYCLCKISACARTIYQYFRRCQRKKLMRIHRNFDYLGPLMAGSKFESRAANEKRHPGHVFHSQEELLITIK